MEKYMIIHLSHGARHAVTHFPKSILTQMTMTTLTTTSQREKVRGLPNSYHSYHS